jgi:hypothetical protein
MLVSGDTSDNALATVNESVRFIVLIAASRDLKVSSEC